MSSHRAESCSDKDTRKSRAVRLGAVLLAVVGVTAAATSAGFTNDAWFSASASSANVSLQGRLANSGDSDWEDADTEGEAIEITVPEGVFANMVPFEKRDVTVDLKNAGTVDLNVVGKVGNLDGDLLEGDASTVTVTIAGETESAPVALEAGKTTTATISVVAGNWDESLQHQDSTDNKLTVDFTGTTVVSGN